MAGSTTSSSCASAARVAFLQDGARLHYALPLALQRAGILDRVFIDWFSAPTSVERAGSRLIQKVARGLGTKMLGRWSPDLDLSRVHRNPLIALQLHAARAIGQSEAWVCRRMARWVMEEGFGQANALMGFIRYFQPELCRRARDMGLVVVGDQIIAPAAIEMEEYRRQEARWKGWQAPARQDDLVWLAGFEQRTWSHLDHVTCASDYVRDGLITQGMDADRITVAPYPIEGSDYPLVDRSGRKDSPVVVGFVGQVGLRKGAPYFFEAARRFDPRHVRFVMLGGVALSPEAARSHKGHVELLGQQPRSHVRSWLEKFDIFYFPSTCEGSAGSVMEAMSSGLPVVTTPNSGSVARDGVDGFVLRYDDIDGQAEAIRRLADDRDLRLAMGLSARRRAEEFDLAWYSQELGRLFGQLLGGDTVPARAPAFQRLR